MKKVFFKASCLAILIGFLGNIAFAEDKSCCTIAGTGDFTLSEEDKAALQDKSDSKESKPQETNDKQNKEKQ